MTKLVKAVYKKMFIKYHPSNTFSVRLKCRFSLVQGQHRPSLCPSCLRTVVTPWGCQQVTWRSRCLMMHVTSHWRYWKNLRCNLTTMFWKSHSRFLFGSSRQNDSYVLPLLWWANPLRLSCPVQLPSSALPPSHFLPSVFCSHYGMVVQIHGQEQDIAKLGVTGISALGGT